MKIRLAITGRSYHATQHLPEEITVADDCPLDDVLAQLAGLLPPDQTLPRSCLVAVAGRHVGTLAKHEACTLHEGDELTLIAPVAGG